MLNQSTNTQTTPAREAPSPNHGERAIPPAETAAPAAKPYVVTWENSVPADWEENGVGVSY